VTTVDTALTPQLVDDFRRDGFAVVPGLLSADERRRYGAAVDEAVGRRSRGDRRTLAEKSRYEQSFIQCQNLWEDSEDVRPLTFHSLLAETAARLLGVGAVRLWHDQALYKEPGGRETDPHQDQPYWPIVETDTITAWIPFDGSTLETGAMGYLRGSHRLGLREFVNIFTGDGEADGGGDGVLGREELAGIEPVFVEVPPGAVAFHHGLTFHLAGANRTGSVRRVHTVIYFADGSTRGEGRFPHPSVERAGIGLGEVIASDVTPLAWPRPDGEPLPPAPARPLR
jgi:ectoine hydroxylase-related dioxygenase (phytanoyl-CoA dioxygenase family)